MKKMENIFRRVLSMLMCICMLTGNVGPAFAATVLTGTSVNAVDVTDQFTATLAEGGTVSISYAGTTNSPEENNGYWQNSSLDQYHAFYWVDVSVPSGQVDNISVTIDPGFDVSGQPYVKCYYDPNAVNHTGTFVYQTSPSATVSNGLVTLSTPGINRQAGHYSFMVGLPIPEDKMTDMMNGTATMFNAVTSVSVNGNSAGSTDLPRHTLAFTPVITKTGTNFTENGTNYIQWTIRYQNNVKLNETYITDEVSEGVFVDDYNQIINGGHAIIAKDHGVAIRAHEEAATAEKDIITFGPLNAQTAAKVATHFDYTTDLELT